MSLSVRADPRGHSARGVDCRCSANPRLVKNYDIAFISTGDVLRHEIAAQSEVGRKVEKIVAAGGVFLPAHG